MDLPAEVTTLSGAKIKLSMSKDMAGGNLLVVGLTPLNLTTNPSA